MAASVAIDVTSLRGDARPGDDAAGRPDAAGPLDWRVILIVAAITVASMASSAVIYAATPQYIKDISRPWPR